MKNNIQPFGLLLATAAIVCVTFFASCRKDIAGAGDTISPQPQAPALYAPCPGVENPANPFDQAGAAHNEGLNYILQHRDQWVCGDEPMKQVLVDLTAEYLCNVMSSGAPENCSEAASELAAVVSSDLSDESVIAAFGSAAAQAYAQQLLDLVANYDDSTQIVTLLDDIKLLEGTVMTAGLIPSEEQAFLQCASIARYSLCYWFQDYQQQGDEWNNCPGAFSAKPWIKTVIIVRKDIVGGMRGCGHPWPWPWRVRGISIVYSALGAFGYWPW